MIFEDTLVQLVQQVGRKTSKNVGVGEVSPEGLVYGTDAIVVEEN